MSTSTTSSAPSAPGTRRFDGHPVAFQLGHPRLLGAEQRRDLGALPVGVSLQVSETGTLPEPS
ncbi:MAG: hypothetical protein QNK03_10825 [Myxococcota bacterium]|nr:hypothetical protein [Myxococcota bacterium]